MFASCKFDLVGGWTRRRSGGSGLSILFHGFPDGRSGLGLLLLRVAVGVLVLLQGAKDLLQIPEPGTGVFALGSLTILVGIALLFGFLTPIAAAMVVIVAGLGCSNAGILHLDLFSPRPLAGFLAAVAGGIVLVGPGAFSVDCRLFGLREIIIRRPR